jgi:ribose-phosphate pyrophosphokinase
MIRLFVDNNQIHINWLEFSDGAKTCKIIDFPDGNIGVIAIAVDPSTKCGDVITELSLVCHAITYVINSESRPKTILNIPYFPYARADRVFETGNPLPLAIFLDSLSSFGFDEIITCDIHNLNGLYAGLPIIERKQADLAIHTLGETVFDSYDFIVCPDKGATRKISMLKEKTSKPVVFSNKVRDVTTGKIIQTNVSDQYDLTNKRLLIVDDIMDNGGTIIPLANKLKEMGASAVSLYVTHLIAPNGLDHLTGAIDKIYCYHTVGGYINEQNVLAFNNKTMHNIISE